jgi:hypothetical protein
MIIASDRWEQYEAATKDLHAVERWKLNERS